MATCDRCKKTTKQIIMSMFNMDMICMDCKAEERKDHMYAKARDAEHAQVVAGNYNFAGIGLPNSLKKNTVCAR